MQQTETEVIIQIKNQQRRIPVSVELSKKEITSARLEADYL